MKFILTLYCIFILSSTYLKAQTWQTIPNAPNNLEKLDDIVFVNSLTGWLVNGRGTSGTIHKSTNGGYTWIVQSSIPAFYRSISFANENTGWAGDLNNLRIVRTTNGGLVWSPVTIASGSGGICGLFAIDSLTIYGCGRYNGPANFYKSTNGGLSWSVTSLAPAATGAVDLHFFNKDTGIIAAGTNTFFSANNRACILRTSNGGATWNTQFVSSRGREWGWKLQFINETTGYASIESWRNVDTVGFLKTTDAGVSWTEYRFEIEAADYHHQGIFFKNELTGWIGGYRSGFTSGNTYQTTNGGQTFSILPNLNNVNRFFKINDTTIFASGRTVYKYTNENVGIEPLSNIIPERFRLYQNYPNPFNPVTNIRFDIVNQANVSLRIYSISGEEAAVLVSNNLKAGEYSVSWDASLYPSGIYLYELRTDELTLTKKMLLLK